MLTYIWEHFLCRFGVGSASLMLVLPGWPSEKRLRGPLVCTVYLNEFLFHFFVYFEVGKSVGLSSGLTGKSVGLSSGTLST